MQPVYVVCGFPRSGTSMMMRAIDAGGIPAIYSDDSARDRDANPHGYFEVDFLPQFDFSRASGKVIKVIDGDHRFIPREPCRIIYMLRDPEEIRLSVARCRLGKPTFTDYEKNTGETIAALRGDGHGVTPIRYADVLARPLEIFASLGWPIDAAKAAAIVDPSLYRMRREA